MLKKTMLAMAGVTAGLSTALIGSGAQAAEPGPVPQTADEVGLLAVCQEATEYSYGSWHYYVPSVTRNGGNVACTLAQGNRSNGVFKLQDALRMCHGQTAVESDGVFGPITAGGLANVTGSSVYTGNFHQINWPLYNANGDFVGLCRNL